MQHLHHIKHSHQTSLRRRMQINFAIGMTLSVLGALAGVMFFVYRTEQEVWDARREEAASHAMHVVENHIEEVTRLLMIIGDLDTVPDNFNLGEILDEDNTLREVIIVDSEDGTVILDERHADSVATLDNAFTIPQSKWYLEARDGRTYVSDVQIDSTGEPYVIMSMPTKNNTIIAGRLSIGRLWEIIGDVQFGNTGRVYVTNASGQIVAYRNTEVIQAGTSIAGSPEMNSILSIETGPFKASWTGKYKNFEGDTVIGTAVAVHDEIGWYIFTEVNASETTTTTFKAALWLGGGTLIMGALLYTLSQFLLRKSVLKPVEALTERARSIGAGNLDERITIDTQTELGILAHEFNGMAENLQRQINEAEQLAIKANEANAFKTSLIARVSHELRTPLGGIMGMSEMLQREVFGSINEKQRDAVDRIVKSAQYLTKMVNELLEQSRLEGNKVALAVTTFDPREPITSVIAINETNAAKKGLALTTEIDTSLPSTVNVDQGKFEQILTNLIGNAIKFTETGFVHVHAYAANEQQWIVEVSDSGIGIPAEAQEHIFEAFRQVDETTTREHEGFGLGLSIVQHLTTLMNGSITLTSTLGKGTTLTVALPTNILQ